MNNRIRIACVAVLGCFTQLAGADGYAMGVTVGSDGLGVEFTTALTDSLNVSTGYSGISVNTTRQISDISYQLDGKFRSLGFKASYFPIDGSRFRATLGVISNGTEFRANARPDGGTFDINGNKYPATAVSSINAWVAFPATSPYLGIGWGNPVRPETHWNFTFDLGLQYLKSMNASLNATCNNNLINQNQCSQLKNDLAQEEKQLQDDVNKISWWPVMRAGVQYQF